MLDYRYIYCLGMGVTQKNVDVFLEYLDTYYHVNVIIFFFFCKKISKNKWILKVCWFSTDQVLDFTPIRT